MIDKIKTAFRKAWQKVKKWWKSLLVALGIIAAAPLVLSQPVSFNYVAATARIDGTPLPIEEIAETRLYCNGSLVVSEPGADTNFLPDLTPGSYTCYATHVDTLGQESDPSNEVTKLVLPARPNPPSNVTVE